MSDIKRYIVFTLLLLIFGIVYEHFSFGVYSIYMMYAFTIPLVLGLIPNIIIYRKNIKIDDMTKTFYNNGVITLSIGSILKGVLDIYGTTNYLLNIYLLVGIFLIVLSIIAILIKKV